MKARDKVQCRCRDHKSSCEGRIGSHRYLQDQESCERHNFDRCSDRVLHRALAMMSWWGIRGVEEGSRDRDTLRRGGFYAHRLQRHVGLDTEQSLYPSSNDPRILHHQREMYMSNRAPRIGLVQLARFEIPPVVASVRIGNHITLCFSGYTNLLSAYSIGY